MGKAIHFNLDNAWPAGAIPFGTLDVTSWGPQLRFSAPSRLIEEFYREAQQELAPFVLYGSGDFHHLTALWIRQVAEPFVLVSFDNHPDWDVRPPRWCCGGWVNRALEQSAGEKSKRVGLRELRVLVAGATLRQSPSGTGGTAGNPSLGRRPAALRSGSAWSDPLSSVARTFHGVRSRVGRIESLCHDRSRLLARGRGRHELGERPVRAWKMSRGR